MTPEQKERDDIAKHVAGSVFLAFCQDEIASFVTDDWPTKIAEDSYRLADALIARGKTDQNTKPPRVKIEIETWPDALDAPP